MKLINNCFSFLERKKDSFNKFCPFFLMIYFFLICTPYIFARVPAINNIVSNSTIAYVLRFIYLFAYCLFGLMLLIANKLKFKWKFLLICLFLFLIFIISAIISPNNVVSYATGFSAKVTLKVTTIGIYSQLTSIARFGGDILCLFFLTTVYPLCFKNRNQFTYVVLPAIVIAFVGIFYSFIMERNTISQVLNGNVSPEKIVSIFHSKNAFGIFLFEGSAAATFIFFADTRKRYKPLIILLPLSLVVSIIISCKLAAICLIVLFAFTYFYSIFRYYKTRKWFSITLIALLSFCCVFTILFFSIPQLHASGIGKTIYDKVIDSFMNLNIGSFFGRTAEWSMVPIMCTGIFSFIGFSQAVGYSVVNSFTSIYSSSTPVSDLHNAYVDFYAYHGVIGCIFLVLLYGFVIYKLCILFKKDKSISIMLFALLIVSMLFGMAETYTLFISMSANTFALSFLILGSALFETKDIKKKNKKEEMINETPQVQ